MSDDIERFNANYAGRYLGDEWVVRASDYEAIESELTAARDEAEKLREDSEHQRERRNAARDCIRKMSVENKRLRASLSRLLYSLSVTGDNESENLRRRAAAIQESRDLLSS